MGTMTQYDLHGVQACEQLAPAPTFLLPWHPERYTSGSMSVLGVWDVQLTFGINPQLGSSMDHSGTPV